MNSANGQKSKQQRYGATEWIAVDAPREGSRAGDRQRNQQWIQQPGCAEQLSDRKERRAANGELRIPSRVADHHIHLEEFRIGIRGQREPAIQQDVRVKELCDFISAVRLAAEAIHGEPRGQSEREHGAHANEYGPRLEPRARTRRHAASSCAPATRASRARRRRSVPPMRIHTSSA